MFEYVSSGVIVILAFAASAGSGRIEQAYERDGDWLFLLIRAILIGVGAGTLLSLTFFGSTVDATALAICVGVAIPVAWLVSYLFFLGLRGDAPTSRW